MSVGKADVDAGFEKEKDGAVGLRVDLLTFLLRAAAIASGESDSRKPSGRVLTLPLTISLNGTSPRFSVMSFQRLVNGASRLSSRQQISGVYLTVEGSLCVDQSSNRLSAFLVQFDAEALAYPDRLILRICRRG